MHNKHSECNEECEAYYQTSVLVGTNGDYANLGNNKLVVRGKIICEEINVALNLNWPKFVFAKDYKLQPLAELETYIKVNQHLPGMPSASEIKEKEGLALAGMLTKQMLKIEELSLYIIMLNNKVIALEVANAKKQHSKMSYLKKYYISYTTICILLFSWSSMTNAQPQAQNWTSLFSAGKQLQGAVGKLPNEIYIGELSAGVYLIIVHTNKKTIKSKLVVQP